jgi:hypothetical protein
MSLFNKLSEYSFSPLETFDALKSFKELYELLRIGSLSDAKNLIDQIGDKAIIAFPEYLKTKSENVLPLFNRISSISKIEELLEEAISGPMIPVMLEIKTIIPEIEPGDLTRDAIDFFMDQGMWDWIEEAGSRKISEQDNAALNMVKMSINDLLEKGLLRD